MLKEIEILRRKIEEQKKTITYQEAYINKRQNEKKSVEDMQTRLNQNKIDLGSLTKKLKIKLYEILSSEPELLNHWITSHIECLDFIKNFSSILFKQARNYIKDRTNLICIIEKGWKNFKTQFILPDTYKLLGYDLFYEFKNEHILKVKNIKISSLQKIQAIEQIRQDITKLTKRNLKNDAALDKGQAWGFSKQAIDEAEKDYKIVAKEIKQKDAYLCEMINSIYNTDSETFTIWINLHLLTCISIIDFSYEESAYKTDKDHVKLSLASDTFYEWKEINKREKKYLIPYISHLSNYDKYFNLILS